VYIYLLWISLFQKFNFVRTTTNTLCFYFSFSCIYRKRNSDLYSSLVEPMAAAGFNRDATQLRTKWKHLKQDYKVELVRIEKNGAASSRMSYFPLLHEVLSCKPSNAMTYLCEVVSGKWTARRETKNLRWLTTSSGLDIQRVSFLDFVLLTIPIYRI